MEFNNLKFDFKILFLVLTFPSVDCSKDNIIVYDGTRNIIYDFCHQRLSSFNSYVSLEGHYFILRAQINSIGHIRSVVNFLAFDLPSIQLGIATTSQPSTTIRSTTTSSTTTTTQRIITSKFTKSYSKSFPVD